MIVALPGLFSYLFCMVIHICLLFCSRALSVGHLNESVLKGHSQSIWVRTKKDNVLPQVVFFYPKTIQSYYHESIISHDVFP